VSDEYLKTGVHLVEAIKKHTTANAAKLQEGTLSSELMEETRSML
jgi:hypothetical protein